MKCPMIKSYEKSYSNVWYEEGRDCLKEECAWWEQDLDLCAIKELALEVRYTQLRLGDLIDKLKPELFRTH